MNTRHTLAAAFAALACGFVSPMMQAQGTLLYTANYDTPNEDFTYGGTYSQVCPSIHTVEYRQLMPQSTCTDSLAIVSSPVRAGSRAVRVTLKNTDPEVENGIRAEMQNKCSFDHENNVHFWYGWSVYVPDGWQFSSTKTVVHQWHTGSGQNAGNPIIALKITNNQWQITTERDRFDDFIPLRSGLPAGTMDVEKDQWTDWVFHVRWSPNDAEGIVQVWKNGTKVVDQLAYHTLFPGGQATPSQNDNNIPPDNGPATQYEKWGIYGIGSSDPVRVLYYDEVRVAKGTGDDDLYSMVAPGGGGGGGSLAAPSALAATATAYNQVNLSWTDNSTAETGFKIERKRDTGGTYVEIATTGANATSYNDTTAGTGTLYYYRVRAYDASSDSSYSNEASATTPEILNRAGHWKFHEGSGTSISDSSSNGNTGTASNGPAWVLSGNPIGYAMQFDGVDDLVSCGSGASLDNLAALTVCAWVKASSAGEGGFGRIVQKGAGTSPTAGWRLLTQGSNQIEFAVDYATTDLRRITAVNAITTGTWYHVMATWTGSATATNARIYVNGNEVTSYATTQNGAGSRGSDSSANFYIGNENTLARTLDGTLDDVRVYNRVLSSTELLAVFRAGL